MAWELMYGPVPEKLHVLHHCDNRACCNPYHLFLGTNKDNVDDKVSKGRAGAPTGENHYEGKLTWEKVDEIRFRYSAGGVTQQALADEFGVTQGLIGHIIRGLKWKLEHRPSCDDCGRWLNSGGECPVCSAILGRV